MESENNRLISYYRKIKNRDFSYDFNYEEKEEYLSDYFTQNELDKIKQFYSNQVKTYSMIKKTI